MNNAKLKSGQEFLDYMLKSIEFNAKNANDYANRPEILYHAGRFYGIVIALLEILAFIGCDVDIDTKTLPGGAETIMRIKVDNVEMIM